MEKNTNPSFFSESTFYKQAGRGGFLSRLFKKKEMKQKPEVSIRKKAMLDALEKSLGVVTTACKAIGISRETHYSWLEKDEKYKQAVNELDNIALDFAETKLHSNISKGSDTAIIFYLKTKGKKRGYIEKQEIDHSSKDGSMTPVINIIKPKDE